MLAVLLWLISAALAAFPSRQVVPVVPPDPGAGRWISKGPYGGAVSSIAVDPTNPDVAYAATRQGVAGVGGVFKTTDGGRTWGATELVRQPVYEVRIAPTNADEVYASTVEGLWKSSNAGKNWTPVLATPRPSRTAIDPNDARRLWTVSLEGTFRSLDGGVSWELLLDPAVLAYDSGDPARLHRITVDQYRFAGFSYSDDNGETWTFGSYPVVGLDTGPLFADPLDPTTLYTGGNMFETRDRGLSWQDIENGLAPNDLAVDPIDRTTLYAAEGRGLFVSHDSGRSYTPALDLSMKAVAATAVAGQPRVYAGGARGIFRSDDGVQWEPSNHGLGGASASALALAPSHPGVVYSLSTSGFAASRDAGSSWAVGTFAPTGSGGLAVSPRDPSLILAAGRTVGLVRSRDGGVTWETAFEPGNVTSAIVFDPVQATIVYAVDFWPLKSTDGGESWRVINRGVEVVGARKLAIDSADHEVLYASAYQSGAFYRSADQGETWTSVDLHDRVNAVVPDTGRSGVVWLATSAGVIRSPDSGLTWTATGFTKPAFAFAVDGTATGAVFVAGEGGDVFRSADAGATWRLFDDGLPGVGVVDLAVDNVTGVIHAATLDGVYTRDLRRRPRVVPPR